MTDNEIIAQFLGFTQKSYTPTSEKMWCDHKHGLPVGELKFDTSWDWLMPVVDMIHSLGFDVSIRHRDTFISRNDYGLMNDQPNYPDDRFDGGSSLYHDLTNIQCVHRAIVEFIKWYNRIWLI